MEGTGVRTAIGILPSCRRESVIFLANLECVFFGDTDRTRDIVANITGFRGYGSRLLPVLSLLYRGDANLLLVGEEPDQSLCSYFSQTLHLALPEVALLEIPAGCAVGSLAFPGGIGQLASHPATLLDGYVTDPNLEGLAARLGRRAVNTYPVCRHANDKVRLFRFLGAAGLPVFDGREATDGEGVRSALAELDALGYRRAVVRAALGASGFGMQVLECRGGQLVSPLLLDGETLLVQGWMEEGGRGVLRVESPSVQFYSGPGGEAVLYDLTEQLLSAASVHEGNLAPPLGLAADGAVRRTILDQAATVVAWVHSLGYRGPGSIDFLVVEQGGGVRVHVCEVNARVTGATYPSLLALNCNPGGAWLMRNFVFAPCLTAAAFLDLLDGKGLLFRPGRGHGILPINVIGGEKGMLRKCQLLFLAPAGEDCRRMMEEFPALLPAACRFDRD
ncbi:MAG: hypothetical protein AB1568_15425 [Thermodesulfobacteriota bacterium]